MHQGWTNCHKVNIEQKIIQGEKDTTLNLTRIIHHFLHEHI